MILDGAPPLIYVSTAESGPPRIRAFSRWVCFWYAEAHAQSLCDAGHSWRDRKSLRSSLSEVRGRIAGDTLRHLK